MIPVPTRIHTKPDAAMNIVPYVDVMLVLLVIFMITTPILEQGIEIDLPEADSKVFDFSGDENNLPMVITVNKTGAYSIGERENLSANRVIAAVKAAQSLNVNQQIMVRGDKNVAYGKVIELMTFLQLADVRKVGFITEPSQ